jgi:hypothetical protein
MPRVIKTGQFFTVLGIRILFLDLPDPDPLVKGTAPDLGLDPSLFS